MFCNDSWRSGLDIKYVLIEKTDLFSSLTMAFLGNIYYCYINVLFPSLSTPYLLYLNCPDLSDSPEWKA